jgi:hypothetical protein
MVYEKHQLVLKRMSKNNGYGKNVRSVVRKGDRVSKEKKAMNNVIAQIAQLKGALKNHNNKKKKGNRNNNRGTSNRQQPFLSKTSGERGMQRMQTKTVTFEEELGVINGSVGFVCTQYNLNPGQANSFPWLALEAKQWEKYRFKSLRYEYTPQVTEFSTNGVGSLVIGFDSDASDAPPNDLIHALNVKPRAYNLPCKKISLNVPPKAMNLLNDGYFVRPGNLPGQCDIKTYDCGMINISTIDQASAAGVGILCVYYTVEFFIPILEPTVGAPMNNSVTYLADSKAALTTTVAYQPLLASAASTSLPVTNGLNVVNTAGSIVPPPGNYILDTDFNVQVTGSTNSITALYISVFKNGVLINPGSGGTPSTGSITNAAGISGILLSSNIYISCNGTDAITTSVVANFSSATTCTTSFRLVSV